MVPSVAFPLVVDIMACRPFPVHDESSQVAHDRTENRNCLPASRILRAYRARVCCPLAMLLVSAPCLVRRRMGWGSIIDPEVLFLSDNSLPVPLFSCGFFNKSTSCMQSSVSRYEGWEVVDRMFESPGRHISSSRLPASLLSEQRSGHCFSALLMTLDYFFLLLHAAKNVP